MTAREMQIASPNAVEGAARRAYPRGVKISRLNFCALLCATACLRASAATYEVGPGKMFSAIGQVPWENLQPGDTVLIGWRPQPYAEKFVLCRQGRPDAPITVRGVPGPDGALPMLDGDGATTRRELDYWGDVRSVIKIGGARRPRDTMPQYIIIENLDIRNAHAPLQFTAGGGNVLQYRANAAAIHVEKAEHLTIRNCRLHDCGNGLFISSDNASASRDILVEGNYFFDNGIARSGLEHNAYTEAAGIIFQFNHFGRLRTNSLGNNLKDRSAGLVVRYNWFDGGNRILDLVDAEDSGIVRRQADYHDASVYGNVLLKLPGDLHAHVVHYGGDGADTANYRKGTLHFYNNTVVSFRAGTTELFWLSSNDERCDSRDNIFHAASPTGKFAVAESAGVFDLGRNWISQGWVKAAAASAAAKFSGGDLMLTGATPGFVDFSAQDFHLAPGSPCRADADKPGLGAFGFATPSPASKKSPP